MLIGSSKTCGAVVLAALFAVRCVAADFTPLNLQGQTFVHDPSTIVRDGTNYFVYSTGPGIRAKSSPDLVHWQNLDSVFDTAWTPFIKPPVMR
jgi:beta-xylosidase